MSNNFFKIPDKVFGIDISFLKLFIVPVLVFLAFIVGFNLVITPKFSQLSQLNGSISSINKEINLTTQKINYLSSIDQQQIKNDVNFLESAVLQEKNSYLLVGVVRSVADKYGFRITSFSIHSMDIKGSDQDKTTLKVANQDVATRMPIEVSLLGPDSKKIELITALENTLPILFIDKLDMSSNNGVVSLGMSISSYYIAEKDDLVSGTLSLSDLIPTKEENDLLKTISSFDKVADSLNYMKVGETSTFVKYDRLNPFTL